MYFRLWPSAVPCVDGVSLSEGFFVGFWEISRGAAVAPNSTATNGKARRPTGPEVSYASTAEHFKIHRVSRDRLILVASRRQAGERRQIGGADALEVS